MLLNSSSRINRELNFKTVEVQTGSRLSCTWRSWALAEERGRPGRAGGESETKRGVISPHRGSFLFKHQCQALPLARPPLLFFPLLLLHFPSSLAPSITYSLSLYFLSSPTSPTVSITPEQLERRGAAESFQPSEEKKNCN